jgi:hypothetical protein
MPLESGSSKDVIKKNFEEFGNGPTFQKTEEKFGKKKANAQRVAVVLSKARGGKKLPKR